MDCIAPRHTHNLSPRLAPTPRVGEDPVLANLPLSLGTRSAGRVAECLPRSEGVPTGPGRRIGSRQRRPRTREPITFAQALEQAARLPPGGGGWRTRPPPQRLGVPGLLARIEAT